MIIPSFPPKTSQTSFHCPGKKQILRNISFLENTDIASCRAKANNHQFIPPPVPFISRVIRAFLLPNQAQRLISKKIKGTKLFSTTQRSPQSTIELIGATLPTRGVVISSRRPCGPTPQSEHLKPSTEAFWCQKDGAVNLGLSKRNRALGSAE